MAPLRIEEKTSATNNPARQGVTWRRHPQDMACPLLGHDAFFKFSACRDEIGACAMRSDIRDRSPIASNNHIAGIDLRSLHLLRQTLRISHKGDGLSIQQCKKLPFINRRSIGHSQRPSDSPNHPSAFLYGLVSQVAAERFPRDLAIHGRPLNRHQRKAEPSVTKAYTRRANTIFLGRRYLRK
ncbi:hypothetical protein D3C73_464290 [compost metagenome]